MNAKTDQLTFTQLNQWLKNLLPLPLLHYQLGLHSELQSDAITVNASQV